MNDLLYPIVCTLMWAIGYGIGRSGRSTDLYRPHQERSDAIVSPRAPTDQDKGSPYQLWVIPGKNSSIESAYIYQWDNKTWGWRKFNKPGKSQ